eukprot:4499937-Pyramimonas_sp.AAC.1
MALQARLVSASMQLEAAGAEKDKVGLFSRRTNRTRDAWVYACDEPIRRRTCGYIHTTNQSDAGRVAGAGGDRAAGRGYVGMMNRSDAGRV